METWLVLAGDVLAFLAAVLALVTEVVRRIPRRSRPHPAILRREPLRPRPEESRSDQPPAPMP
ncbi:hypothetical protein FHR36_004787 [Kitasatospora paracochleata]|uniref:Uncharacterized protein n=1 Tax=Kitasatospora paracochleata TaxID=58354 RepID=A0ABT1J386_9ACTN|nr:hypothetical protein [Kitasatospora paracochleata]